MAALMFLVAAEAAVRVASPKLASLNTWNDWEATNKVEAMDALAKRGGASVVFVGSSMTNAALDPSTFSLLAGGRRPAFNAALNGAGAQLLDLWTLGVVVPRLRPAVVVVGLSSRELNDAGAASDRAFRAVRRSPGGRSIASDLSPTERIQWIGERASYLVRYRRQLRAPSRLFDTPAGKQRSSVGPLGALGALRLFETTRYKVNDKSLQQSLGGFSIGGREQRALRHLVDRLTAARIRVVLVEMPLTDDAIAAHPGGAADYRRFENVLDVFSASARVIDADAWFEGTADFVDPLHLNSKGRERFTRMIVTVTAASP